MRAATLILALAAALTAAPALAQGTSPAEQQVDQTNRSIMRQQRQMRESQQNQFETNQLRNQIQRNRPPITGPSPPTRRGCRGSIC